LIPRLIAHQSGDAVVNDTFLHSINLGVPFGGVGRSGHGTYRGRLSFEAFTYQRGVLWRHGLLDIDQTLPFNVRAPPSGKIRQNTFFNLKKKKKTLFMSSCAYYFLSLSLSLFLFSFCVPLFLFHLISSSHHDISLFMHVFTSKYIILFKLEYASIGRFPRL